MKTLSIITLLIFSVTLSAQNTLTSLEEIEHCTQPETVTVITLWYDDAEGLKAIPVAIEGFINLKELKIKRADLGDIEFDFSRLEHLEELEMNDCKVTTLPLSLFECKKLRFIDLYNNSIKTIPEQIDKLNDLEYLFLSSNKGMDLPKSISNLKKLKSLEMINCGLQVIPEGVYSCISLTDLCLGKNPIGEISPKIGKLKLLEQLALNDTQIEDLPMGLKKCNTLKSVYIKGTPLSKNPKRIKELELLLNKKMELYPIYWNNKIIELGILIIK